MRPEVRGKELVVLGLAVLAAGFLAYLVVGALNDSSILIPAVLWGLWSAITLGFGVVALWRRGPLPWGRFLTFQIVGSLALLGFFMIPAVAHELRYALPYGGLPPRIGHAGRDYEGDGACAEARNVTVSSHDHIAQIGTLWTLFGSPRSIVTTSSAAIPGVTSTVIFVHDGQCYRPYELEGGP